jgi:hypothetical protein
VTARRIDRPEPGFYKRRLVKGGPWVGVRFYRDGEGGLGVEVNGRTCRADGTPLDPHEEWPLCRPSTEADVAHFARVRDWAIRHGVAHPSANPYEPIDLPSMPPRSRP